MFAASWTQRSWLLSRVLGLMSSSAPFPAGVLGLCADPQLVAVETELRAAVKFRSHGLQRAALFPAGPAFPQASNMPSKTETRETECFYQSSNSEEAGRLWSLGKANQRQTLRKHFVKKKKIHRACNSAIDSMEGNLLGTERLRLFLSPCWKSGPRREVGQIPRQSVWQIIGIKMLLFPYLLNYSGALRKILHPEIVCGNTIVERFTLSFYLSIYPPIHLSYF